MTGGPANLCPHEFIVYANFADLVDFMIFTEEINYRGAVAVYRLEGMSNNMICITGDKGDAAQLLGLPTLLIDD